MIKLFCDMGADIPKDLIEKNGITVLTMPISDGENEYTLGLDIDKFILFENMEKGVKYTTSQVSYKDFYDNFKREIDLGNDVMYISLSSGISGTYNTATMVRNTLIEEYPNANIYVLDSFGATFGYGFLVLKVANMIKENFNIEKILDFIEFSKKHINYLFSVDDLTYLYRGGRLSRTKYLVGSLLNINPILQLIKSDGTLSMVDKARGNKAFKRKLIELLKSKSNNLQNQTLLVLHGDCRERAEEIKDLLISELNNNNILIYDVDAVIGCHTGPSVVVVVFLDELYGIYDNFCI